MKDSVDLSAQKPSAKWRRVRSSPWFHLFLALALVSLMHGFIVKPYSVPSGSMEQTLEVGDRIYANRLAYLGDEPESGNIVVFSASEAWGERPQRSGLRWIAGAVGDVLGFGPSNQHALVKRVIGVPDDTVSCCSIDGAVEVNGEALEEPYIFDDYPFETGTLDCVSTTRSQRCFGPVTVGRDEFLMLGDHRSRSSDSIIACRRTTSTADSPDSACARFAMRDDIVGKVFTRIWPLSRFGGV